MAGIPTRCILAAPPTCMSSLPLTSSKPSGLKCTVLTQPERQGDEGAGGDARSSAAGGI